MKKKNINTLELSDQNKFIEKLDKKIDQKLLKTHLDNLLDKLDPVEKTLLKDYSLFSINKICEKYNKNYKTINRKLNKIFNKVRNMIQKGEVEDISNFL